MPYSGIYSSVTFDTALSLEFEWCSWDKTLRAISKLAIKSTIKSVMEVRISIIETWQLVAALAKCMVHKTPAQCSSSSAIAGVLNAGYMAAIGWLMFPVDC